MKVNIQQGSEEINSIGGIALIGGLFNSLKNLKTVDLKLVLSIGCSKPNLSNINKVSGVNLPKRAGTVSSPRVVFK